MDIRTMLLENTAGELRRFFLGLGATVFSNAQEIRLRQGQPIAVRGNDGDIFLKYSPTAQDIAETLSKLANHSLYAYENEIKNGYITLPGGHRVGIAGRATIEGGQIKTIKHISALAIRIARQVIGAADPIMPRLLDNGQINNAMIISPPGWGKTTILRDAIRQLSYGGHNVVVIDERSEIAGCHLGIPQNDLGPRADVLDAAPKAQSMMLALRALCPDIIAVDEIASADDVAALENMAAAGIAILCTIHGRDMKDLHKKPLIKPLLDNNIISQYIFLEKQKGVAS